MDDADRPSAAQHGWAGAPLPDVLEYTGEFGVELVLFMPFVNALAATGELGDRTVRTYRGMRPFYERLGVGRVEEKDAVREWVPAADRPRWLPRRDEHGFDGRGPSTRLRYPDMRRLFGGETLPQALEERIRRKPLLVVHNKFNVEWDARPFNHIPLAALESCFRRLAGRFTIVYIRHGKSSLPEGYSGDHNDVRSYDDARLLAKHPEVVDFDKLYADQVADGEADFNTFKAALYARCRHFVTSQGGGSQQIAQYSGGLVCVYHRKGKEARWAYGPGYFTFMAEPAPTLLLCTARGELEAAFGVLSRSATRDGRALVAEGDRGTLAKLSAADVERRADAARRALTRRRERRQTANKVLRRLGLKPLPVPLD